MTAPAQSASTARDLPLNQLTIYRSVSQKRSVRQRLRFRQVGGGFGLTAGDGGQDGSKIVFVGVAGADSGGGFEVGNGFGVASGCDEERSQVGVRFFVVRVG